MKKTMKQLLFSVLMSCLAIFSYAQQRTVTGTVTDEQGAPLSGVSYVVKGTARGGITGQDGTFSVSAGNNSQLEFSAVGYKTQTATVGTGDVIIIKLMSDEKQLEGVVVTAMGISRQQRALGYASSTIKADELTKTASPNFATALYGKAPGVRIAASPGGATSGVNITIRGLNSIFGKNQPLIVMDGIPIRDGEVKNNDYWSDQRIRGNGLLDLNNEDIENISILKGAAAGALYGSSAVNGVVLVTTKKGKKGFNVDFSANYSVDKIAYLPRYQSIRGPGAPLNVNNAGQDADGFLWFDTDNNGSKETRGVPAFTINFGPKFDGKPTIGWDGVVRPYNALPNRYDGLFQPAHNSTISVAVSQGTENSTTRFSLTRQTTQGISLGSNNSKNVASLTNTMKLGKKMTVDVVMNYINQHIHNRPYAIDRLINNFTGMMGTFENADMYLNKYKTSLGYRFVTGTDPSLTPKENINRSYGRFKDDIADYVWRVKENNEDEYSDRLIASITDNWEIVKGLSLRTRLATDYTGVKITDKNRSEKPVIYGYTGGFGLGNSSYTVLYGDALLTYTKKVTPDLELNVMGGYNAESQKYQKVRRDTRDGLTVENWFDLSASRNGNPWASNERSYLLKDAFVGTVNFSYKSFLFLEAAGRRDRTSTLNPARNSFFYPSVNASFIFSDALQMPSFINYGKLRASWGVVGNYPDPFQANVLYNGGAINSSITTTIPTTMGNELLRPERKNEFEFGLESRMLNGRLNLDLSYYNGRIIDQLLPMSLAPTSGATNIWTNVGILRNNGIELALFGTPVKTNDFEWVTGVNIAKNKNKIEKLYDNSNEYLHADFDGNAAQLKSTVGEPMGDFYAHPIAVNSSGQKIISSDGLYQLDGNKMIKVGNSMPKVTGGFSNTFSFKGFTLEALADFRFGGYVMPTGINWMISRGLLNESLNYMDAASGGMSYYVDANGKGVSTTASAGPTGQTVYHDGMLMEGVTADGKPNTNIISQAYYYWNTYNWGGPQYGASRYELYIVKNSYVKMRELSLGYSLPRNISSKVRASKMQLSLFGRNLFYFYRTIKDMDAEQLTSGSRWAQTLTNGGNNPPTRSYGIMLRANF